MNEITFEECKTCGEITALKTDNVPECPICYNRRVQK